MNPTSIFYAGEKVLLFDVGTPVLAPRAPVLAANILS